MECALPMGRTVADLDRVPANSRRVEQSRSLARFPKGHGGQICEILGANVTVRPYVHTASYRK